ncbi:hypothetical protein [Leptospira noguchii]|uniref:hypothetical protein n=1 Tax=Leptospira noguchii TaxID=28182 RepID=UPI001E34E4FC|nr:hypothetical protein [Leptospira noguchii]
MHRSLRVALQGRVNSAKRFLRKRWKLSKTLSYGSRFRIDKLRLRTIVVLCFLHPID